MQKSSLTQSDVKGKKVIDVNIIENKEKEKVKLIIDFISTFVTVASMLICFFTLIEMRIEQNNAYRPVPMIKAQKLYIETGISEIDGTSISDMLFGIVPAADAVKSFDSEYVEEYVDFPNTYHYYLPLSVHNVGMGVCKELTITYLQSSYIEWLEEWERIGYLEIEDRHYEGDALLIKVLAPNYHHEFAAGTILYIPPSIEDADASTSLDNSDYIPRFSVDRNDMTVSQDVVLPNGEDTCTMYLPYEYTRLLSMIQFTYERDDYVINFPPISAKVSYKDVKGKKYNENIDIQFEYCDIRISENNGTAVLIYNVSESIK